MIIFLVTTMYHSAQDFFGVCIADSNAFIATAGKQSYSVLHKTGLSLAVT